VVDVHDATAYSLEVVQTPVSSSAESLLKHYASLIIQRAPDILKYSNILAVDGYFMKEGFIREVHAAGLTLITKARQDANMRYLYKGVQSNGRGRKKKHDGKVCWKAIDKRRWKLFYENDDILA
jgi:hypothetical protein